MAQTREVFRRFRYIGVYIYVAGVAVAAACVFPLWAALSRLHAAYLASLPPSLFVIPDQPASDLWLAAALFISFGLGLLAPTLLAPAFFHRESLERFWLACSALDHFDSRKIIVYPGLVLIVLPLVASIFLGGWHSRFDESGIHSKDMFSLTERFRPYEDVTRVVQVAFHRGSDGRVDNRPYFRIDFRDGTFWKSTDQSDVDDAPVHLKKLTPLMELVCRKAGKPLEQEDCIDE
jgi:hypothetical protein